MTEASLVLQALAVLALVALFVSARNLENKAKTEMRRRDAVEAALKAEVAKIHTALLIRIVEKLEGKIVVVPGSAAVSHAAPIADRPAKPPPVSQPPPVATQPQPVSPDPNIHEIVKRHGLDGQWEHHGWCRAHTPAWQRVWDTPHEALRTDGRIVEGVQHEKP